MYNVEFPLVFLSSKIHVKFKVFQTSQFQSVNSIDFTSSLMTYYIISNVKNVAPIFIQCMIKEGRKKRKKTTVYVESSQEFLYI